MRLLVCGSREWSDGAVIRKRLDKWLGICQQKGEQERVIIQGGARGVDGHAKFWAEQKEGKGVTVLTFDADWAKYGRGAGPIRNKKMLLEGKPDEVYAFHPDLKSSLGTRNMIEQAESAGVLVRIFDKQGQELFELHDVREER